MRRYARDTVVKGAVVAGFRLKNWIPWPVSGRNPKTGSRDVGFPHVSF